MQSDEEQRGDQPGECDPAAPDSIPPMDAEELTAIGERLFGRWGWPPKIGAAVGKDQSTVRRWRNGVRIAPEYAKIIRGLAAEADKAGAPAWEAVHGDSGKDAMRALTVVARAQARAAIGLKVSIRVHEESDGVSMTLRIGSGQPMAAAFDPVRGGFPGLREMEAALTRMAALGI